MVTLTRIAIAGLSVGREELEKDLSGKGSLDLEELMKLRRISGIIGGAGKLLNMGVSYALMLSVFFALIYVVGDRLPTEGFRKFTIESRLAGVEKRSLKNTRYKVVGNCLVSNLGNFGNFTNLGIGGTNHNNNLAIIEEYCQEQDYIFHFVSLPDSYTRELPADIDRFRFLRVIRQTQMFVRDQLGEISGLNPVPIGPAQRVTQGSNSAYVARDVAISNGEITKGVAFPLIDTEFLERDIEKHPNTIFVLAPFNQKMPGTSRNQKATQAYGEFRDAMMQSPYPVFDLTDAVSSENFYIPDMIHYKVGTKKMREMMMSFGARLEEELSANPTADLTGLVRTLNKEIREKHNL